MKNKNFFLVKSSSFRAAEIRDDFSTNLNNFNKVFPLPVK